MYAKLVYNPRKADVKYEVVTKNCYFYRDWFRVS